MSEFLFFIMVNTKSSFFLHWCILILINLEWVWTWWNYQNGKYAGIYGSPWNQCMSKLKSILGNNSFLNVILYPTITSNWTRVFTQSSPLSHPCRPLPPFPNSLGILSPRVLYSFVLKREGNRNLYINSYNLIRVNGQ